MSTAKAKQAADKTQAKAPAQMTGAEMVLKALIEQGVEVIFGYPGGAVLPIYDEIFKNQGKIKHVLCRHEQGATHAAEGYARSTGKVGCVLVTSGPGATNAVTGLTDALLDSIPMVCLTGQVPSFLIGTNAFQEADTTGITRPCTKHNYLIKSADEIGQTVHEAFHVARTGRPGPVVIDIPKDLQFASGTYQKALPPAQNSYNPKTVPDMAAIEAAVELMANAKKPVFYTGGGIINAGPEASQLIRELVADAAEAMRAMLEVWKNRKYKADKAAMKTWWEQINKWRAKNCLAYKKHDQIIKPQYALERLRDAMAKDPRDGYITTEVGQHQMWAAQFLPFNEPNRWMTSGGLGTMGANGTP